MDYYELNSLLREYRLIYNIAIGVLLLVQCLSTGITKRNQKNFISDNSFFDIVLKSCGLYIVIFEGIIRFDSDNPNILLVKLGIFLLLISVIIHIYRSRRYQVYNIIDNELDIIIKDVLKKNKINFKQDDDKHIYELDLEGFKKPKIKINQRGVFKEWYELKFIKYREIDTFDGLIDDIRDRVNTQTKPSKYRGVSELLASVFIVSLIVFMSKL
ncbi:hypothetical protein [Serpentinicella alkaliphila]|uniref:Uncharacterized protein n=1 Tax=Serpentinicella alkaliphila TaxID=1734049 RepID=A0A4R2TKV1_9FIRM|nr:hypothetical protein [Serpentinicella alkaliphila]QUH26510.1 hypothetical protein HZR23_12800 [Serpentinicella alkaliphila]TCP95492.1 hypothetical protein EDD79_10597 [Serpentinicella alkaliphila]